MDESEREPPHAGERLTRQDALRLIEEHGGPEDLDLREANLQEAVLTGMDLHGANLERAYLQKAHLVKANLQGANLQECSLSTANLQRADFVAANLQEAKLDRAELQGACLQSAALQQVGLCQANLRRADLFDADLQGADLSRANLRDANLEEADWGNYVLGDEIEKDFNRAASVYRTLKLRYTDAGMYDIAGEFHYREMEARRKLAWKGGPTQREKPLLPYALALNAFRLLYGYGERPERVIGWAAVVVFGLALVHWLFGTVTGGFLDALYYSAVSFTALGYGASDSDPQGWAGRFLGAGESFLGVFMMALFVGTLTRKMTR